MARKSQKTAEQAVNTPALIAWHVPERENASWTRIGAAWANRDGKGFTLQLDLIPATTGRIVLRNFEPKAEGEAA